MVHPPWFLARYQRWWMMERATLVSEVDFAVLILRICSYASQFLPSPSYTMDKIRGVLLSDIRNTSDEVAESLAAISSACDGRGSLFRVQHLAFFSLRRQMDGRRDTFWDALSRSIRVAQSVGIHSETTTVRPGVDEVEKEMGRRTFCNLYIWDSLLSRQLDRIAFLPGCLNSGNWPQMHLGGEGDGIGADPAGDAPESFTERVLQARLADFWRRIGPMAGTEYDMMVAEERYEQFCREYLAELPPAFALHPSHSWDKRLPKLPMQRQLLHIAIYDSLCWNFRPLLLRLPHEKNLPAYKRMLLDSQKRALIVAALHVLEGVSQLHAMLGGCHTRFSGLVFSTFDAAVLLISLGMDPLPLQDDSQPSVINTKNSKNPDPLRVGTRNLSQQGYIEAVQGAVDRLRMLAEVSNMADVGASTLTQLLSKMRMMNATDQDSVCQSQQVAGDILTLQPSDLTSRDDSLSRSEMSPAAVGDITSWSFFSPSDLNSQDDYISRSVMQDLQSNWGAMIELNN